MVHQESQPNLGCRYLTSLSHHTLSKLALHLNQGTSLKAFCSQKARARPATMRGHCWAGMFAKAGVLKTYGLRLSSSRTYILPVPPLAQASSTVIQKLLSTWARTHPEKTVSRSGGTSIKSFIEAVEEASGSLARKSQHIQQ